MRASSVRITVSTAILIAFSNIAIAQTVDSADRKVELSAEQRAALTAIYDHGGILIQLDEQRPGRPIIGFDFTGHSDIDDQWLRSLRPFGELSSLQLAGTAITDAGLVELAAFKRLQTVDLSRTHVTQVGIDGLRQRMPQLTVVVAPPPPNQRFTEDEIRHVRRQARELSTLPESTPNGWSKSPIDPASLLKAFPLLHIRDGYVLRAYIFKENGNSNGFVWALPAEAEFPKPDECPRLESHVLRPPKPFDALDDVMEAIIGDDSAASYLQASLLRRELKDFGAGWHGVAWGMNMVFDDDPWKVRPDLPEDSPARLPTSDPADWKWLERKPESWTPEVRLDATRATVTYYSYTPLAADAPGDQIERERIYRHIDTFRRGKYRPLDVETKLAEGPDAISF
jgi:hypothetical protein